MKTLQNYEEDNTYGQNTLSNSMLFKEQKRLRASNHGMDGEGSTNSTAFDIQTYKDMRALNGRTTKGSVTSSRFARDTTS